MNNVVVLSLKKIEGKNQLRAFADILLFSHLTVRSVRLMETSTGYWIAYPSDNYKGKVIPFVAPSERIGKEIREAMLNAYQDN